MVNITSKHFTLRQAIAVAELTVSSEETIAAVREKRVPKGDLFEFSRAAGLLAIKNTHAVIPDCHPLPVEYAAISHEIEGLTIRVQVEVHTIYKTGVEVEAMHGAAITALTMYDMLKPIDPAVHIGQIKLREKKGGKSEHKGWQPGQVSVAVIVCSDSVARGLKEDSSGTVIIEKLAQHGLQPDYHEAIPDDVPTIQDRVRQLADRGLRLLIFSGGTGLSPRDVTPDAIAPLLDRQIPGIMEAARAYGQQRTPYAMLSRGIAGFIGDTLVITLPGSPRGAAEGMDALFPYILHLFRVAEGLRHEEMK